MRIAGKQRRCTGKAPEVSKESGDLVRRIYIYIYGKFSKVGSLFEPLVRHPYI